MERQIQIKGPDAKAFVDMAITRRAPKVGKLCYATLCNPEGGIINDPVLLRPAEDEFWFSLADSDAGLWLQGVNAFGKYDVSIGEIDVAPLSLAGPHATDTWVSLMGPAAHDLPFYGMQSATIAGCDVEITRPGFSSESNFEIYLHDASRNAELLYHAIMEAGKQYGIREIAIPHHSRIEGGLLSFGQDMDIEVNPYEVGLGWQVNLKKEEFIGRDALKKIKHEGTTHSLVGIRLGGKPIDWYPSDFFIVHSDSSDDVLGYVTSAWYCPSQESNIAFAMLPNHHAAHGTKMRVALPPQYSEAGEEPVAAQVVDVPFRPIDSQEDRTGPWLPEALSPKRGVRGGGGARGGSGGRRGAGGGGGSCRGRGGRPRARGSGATWCEARGGRGRAVEAHGPGRRHRTVGSHRPKHGARPLPVQA